MGYGNQPESGGVFAITLSETRFLTSWSLRYRITWTDDDDGQSSKGNLLRFWAETDPVLSHHLAKSPHSAQYTSKISGRENLKGYLDRGERGNILFTDC